MKITLCLFLLFPLFVVSGEFPIDSLNNPRKVFWDNGNTFIRSVVDMRNYSLESGVSRKKPWSGYYWPYAYGGVAYRYNSKRVKELTSKYKADKVFPLLFNEFKRTSKEFFQSSPNLDHLSPAEKYDLLLGDYNFTLTKSLFSKFNSIYNSNNRIPQWFGICDGWAAASIKSSKPQKSVEFILDDGRKLVFSPHDIEALLSLLWSHSRAKMAGQRCGGTNNCPDLNPGSFHLGLVNQIGVNGESFVIDNERQTQVWNHPVYKYELRYFNVQTRKSYQKLKDNLIPISSLTYRNYNRSREARYILGVTLNYTYADLSYSVQSGVASQKDKTDTVNYDLELNDKYQVVGGEWRSDKYPDFMWVPYKKNIEVHGERLVSRVLNESGLPSKEIKVLAIGGSLGGYNYKGNSRLLVPVPSLVNYLLKKSL